jgi:hypothetical protein
MLKDLKELEKFLKICRKQGIDEISFEGLSVKFGSLPLKAANQIEEDEILTDELSPDELIFYAANNAGQI